jgi:hypothetical protein
MKTLLTLIAAAGWLAAPAFAQHAGHGHAASPAKPAAAATPYAGLQTRAIKSLSAEDTRMLLEGHGMSLALAAELNGYPGPAHVLELADALKLDASQRERTQALMHAHKAEAGARVVAAEQELDRAFASGQATEAQVVQLTQRIGALQAELRAAHLRTHLQQVALLNREQVAQYQQLRGYKTAAAGGTR